MNLDRGKNEMAGLKGKSGPPGNMNSFKHGLSTIAKNQQNGTLTMRGGRIKTEVRDGLIKDKGGDDTISTAEKVLVELISDLLIPQLSGQLLDDARHGVCC
jgi:hypothetical protein